LKIGGRFVAKRADFGVSDEGFFASGAEVAALCATSDTFTRKENV
jgi:hypothetical protein